MSHVRHLLKPMLVSPSSGRTQGWFNLVVYLPIAEAPSILVFAEKRGKTVNSRSESSVRRLVESLLVEIPVVEGGGWVLKNLPLPPRDKDQRGISHLLSTSVRTGGSASSASQSGTKAMRLGLDWGSLRRSASPGALLCKAIQGVSCEGDSTCIRWRRLSQRGASCYPPLCAA